MQSELYWCNSQSKQIFSLSLASVLSDVLPGVLACVRSGVSIFSSVLSGVLSNVLSSEVTKYGGHPYSDQQQLSLAFRRYMIPTVR